jgi:sugar lactone lactonase YvrE
MKKFFTLSAFVLGLAGLVSAQKLTPLWQTDTLLRTPESVLYDAKNKILYVANIDGKPDEKDGNGFISQVSLDGKIKNLEWVKGLDAPKGMGLSGNTLYVADITSVVIIDIVSGKIINRLEIQGSKFLNDITVDEKGNVYVSDTGTGKIHKISAGNIDLYFESKEFQSPNGLLALKEGLYIVDFGTGGFFKLGWDKKLTKVCDIASGGDGIVRTGKDQFIVSSWYGEIYSVNKGAIQKLQDTKEQKSNSADVAFNDHGKVLYVPTFFKNSVAAFTLGK